MPLVSTRHPSSAASIIVSTVLVTGAAAKNRTVPLPLLPSTATASTNRPATRRRTDGTPCCDRRWLCWSCILPPWIACADGRVREQGLEWENLSARQLKARERSPLLNDHIIGGCLLLRA